jgi:hypothetical protein
LSAAYSNKKLMTAEPAVMIMAVAAVPKTVPAMPKREVKNAATAAAKPAAIIAVSLTAGCLSSPLLSMVRSSSLLTPVIEQSLLAKLTAICRIHISTTTCQEVTRAIKDCYQSVTNYLTRICYPAERHYNGCGTGADILGDLPARKLHVYSAVGIKPNAERHDLCVVTCVCLAAHLREPDDKLRHQVALSRIHGPKALATRRLEFRGRIEEDDELEGWWLSIAEEKIYLLSRSVVPDRRA